MIVSKLFLVKKYFILSVLLLNLFIVKGQVAIFPYTEDFGPKDATTTNTPNGAGYTVNLAKTGGVSGNCAGIDFQISSTNDSWFWIYFSGISGRDYTISFYEKLCTNINVYIDPIKTTAAMLGTTPIFSQNNSVSNFTLRNSNIWSCPSTGDYYVAFKIVNGTANTGRIDDVTITETIPCTPPTTSASATGNPISVAGKFNLNINWVNGNGDKVLVVAKASTSSSVPPVIGTPYTANATFGTGSNLGSANYVVYDGTGNTVNVTGLNPNTTYNFYIYTYESASNCYKLSSPYILNGTTLELCSAPVIQASYINFPNKTNTTIDVAWSNGNGDKVLVVARLNATASVAPTLLTPYTANSVFGAGQTTGAGNFVVYNGTGTSVTVTGLTEATSYSFDIYAFNSIDNCYTLTQANAAGSVVPNILTGTTTTKSEYYNIQTLSGSTIVTCEGKLVDGGGVSGNYTSGSAQTLTFQSENAGDGVCLTFTQWEISNYSSLTFYDGANTSSPLIYLAAGDWNQTSGTVPLFKGPGVVCSSGDYITVKFTPSSGSGIGFLANLSCYSPPSSCTVDVSSPRTGICRGESVELTATGLIGGTLLNNDFNTSTLGTDWTTLINARFDNPCKPGLDGVYFWTNTDAPPRDLTSLPFDVSQGGSISFDFRMAVQAGNTEPSYANCEGSDLIYEGIFLEYSANNGPWVQIHYFFPPSATTYSSDEVNSWKRYYFEIPAAARTASTRFRWNQYRATEAPYDVWGLDRINITTVSPYKIVWKDMTANAVIGTSANNTSPYKVTVSPTVNTIYRAIIIDALTGAEVCYKELSIAVSDFTATPTPVSACGASDGSILITPDAGSVGPFEYSINNAYTFQTSGTFNTLPAGTYPIVVKSLGCIATKSVVISSNSGGPSVDALSNINQCVGTNASQTFSSSTPGSVLFTWTNTNTSIGLAPSGSGDIASFTLVNTTGSPIVSTITVTPELNGCIGTPTTFTITVKPKDDANFILADFCNGVGAGGPTAASNIATPGGAFSILPLGPSINTSTGLISGGVAGTTYSVTYTTPNCVNTYSQNVLVKNLNDASFDYQDFCEGDPTLSLGGATSIMTSGGVFSWDGAPPAGVTLDPVNAAVTGTVGGQTYNIKYTTPAGACQSSSTNSFDVKALDIISYTLADICFGTAATPVSGLSPIGGSFDFTNPPAAGVTIDPTTGVISGGVAGDSFEVFYSSLGTASTCPNIKESTVNVVAPPLIAVQPQNSSECNGTAVSFSVTANNANTYQWQISTDGGSSFSNISNGGVYSDATTPILSISDNTGLNNNQYQVVIEGAIANCSLISDAATLTAIIIEQPVINCGTATPTSVEFNWAALSGATSYTISYTINSGAPQNGGSVTSPTFSLGGLTANDAVEITVNAVGSSCYIDGTKNCTASACSPPVISTPPANISTCENTGTSFSVTATNANSYQWQISADGGLTFNLIVDGGIYSGANTSTLTISIVAGLDQYQYNVLVIETPGTCETLSSAAILTVNNQPNAGSDGSSTICENDASLIDLFSIITGEDAGGTWTRTSGTGGTFNGSAGTFTSSVGATTSTFSYTLTALSPCVDDESEATITINPIFQPTLSCGVSTTSTIDFDWADLAGATSYDITYTVNGGGVQNGGSVLVSAYTQSGLSIGDNVEITVTPIGVGCFNSATITCAANNCTPPIITGTLIICEGASSQLTGAGTPDATNPWSSSNTLAATVDAAGLVTSAASGSTNITYTDDNGCSNVATITVNNQPNAGNDGSSIICENDASVIDLFSIISGEDAGGTWTRTSGTGGTFNAPSGTFTSSLGATSSTFTYSLTASSPCVDDESEATITINPILQPNLICVGSTTSSVDFDWEDILGATSYNITYNVNGGGVQNGGSVVVSTYIQSGLSAGDNVDITVTPIGIGCFTSATINCSANNCTPPIITGSLIICQGSSSQLSGAGTPDATSPWSSSNTLVATVDATGLVNSVGSGSTNITYTDDNGCSNVATITINLLPTASITGASTVCMNDPNPNIIFTGLTGSAPYTFTYTINGTGSYTVTTTSGNAVSLPVATSVSGSFGYSITNVSDANCSKVITGQNATITVNANPTSSIVQYSDISCDGFSDGSAVIGANGGLPNYSYSIDGNIFQPQNSFINLAPNTYTFTVKDQNGCLSTVNQTISPAPVIIFIVDPLSAEICFGESVTITASGYNTFDWYDENTGLLVASSQTSLSASPAISTSYKVVSSPCNKEASTFITVWDKVYLEPISDTLICLGETISFKANAAGGAGNTIYTWNPTLDYTSPLGDSVSTSPSSASTITYTLTVANDCPGESIAFDLIISPLPIINIQSITEICEGEEIDLFNASHLPEYVNYLWDFKDGESSIDTFSTSHVFQNAGTYTVNLTVTDTNNCSNFGNNSPILVNENPTAIISNSPSDGLTTNSMILFTGRESFDNITSYHWNFDVSGESNKRDTVVNYQDAGTFTIQLIVNNANCSDTATKTIVIDSDFGIFIPNGFTPNDDGDNDYFNAKGFGIIDYQMQIWDRWGELVFETTDINIGWDGRKQGESLLAPDGVYVYRIKYLPITRKDDEMIERTGHVTLLK